ncbi:hypothetical protein ESZ36_00320 [Colwellia demingiae]|uniref:Uncharacterized protein n=1 Tax=Colwellia demingiae TaxID=89401 RepID=A0A5C6QR25_9GAMM|nr:hypothetical protein [Colwellia demingiae]TWX71716.1 hypothetical protein ESZ36_00320 [Colwellia demingiae]
MTKIIDISETKTSLKLIQLSKRIKSITDDEKNSFNSLKIKGDILGDWSHYYWECNGRRIYFTKPFDVDENVVTSKTHENKRVIIPDLFSDLLKVYCIRSLKKGTSAKATSTKVGAIAWFFHHLNFKLENIPKANQDKLDSFIPLMQEFFVKRGPYERVRITRSFIKKLLIPTKLVSSFDPKINMVNPAVSQTDVTTDEYKDRSDSKYLEDIDKYVGIVKRKFNKDIELIKANKNPIYGEPKPGYDELRLLATPFFLAFGLRVGELCRLPENALGYDEVNEKYFLRVLTEKGELAAARPCPRIWQDVIKASFERILELTKPSRARSVEIEKNSELALAKLLSFNERSQEIAKAITSAGFSPNDYFLRSEINQKPAPSDTTLPWSTLRHKDFDYAAKGKISVKNTKDRAKIYTVIYSKKMVIQALISRWNKSHSIVFKENITENGVLKTKVKSKSYQYNLPFSKHLFCAFEATFSGQYVGQGLLPRPMTPRNISRWFCSDSSRSKTVFERYDVKDEDGKFISIASHQFRHWLTTALKRSGKNEMMIDQFMARQPGQSRQYDHRTAKERAEVLRRKYLSDPPPDDALGARIKRMRDNNVSLDEIESAVIHSLSVLHFTPWGTCKRDLDINPCEKGMMCLRGENGEGCQHFGIDTDDHEALINIQNTKILYENQLSALLPNYKELMSTLNRQEPLDQHIQYCIDTINGCEKAISSYNKAKKNQKGQIDIVQVFVPEKD